MATFPSALRKQLEAADKCFADGNLKSAKMHADMAAALFVSAPEAQRAQAAYKVHVVAAATTKDKPDHYAVLGIKLNGGKPDGSTHDAVRTRHKELCGLLGPAKDSNAAVAAAYKLVDDAFLALMDIKKSVAPAESPLKRQPWAVQRKPQKQQQQEEAEEEDDDYYGRSGGRRRN